MLIEAKTEQAKFILVKYLSYKLETTPGELIGTMPYSIFAMSRTGKNIGAVLYTNYRETSIEMMWAGEIGWATRSTLREIFEYPFDKLKVLRATGCVERTNNASRLFAARIGCREAGVLENEYGIGKDGILYTMTRERCRWLKGYHNGETQNAESSRSARSRRRAVRSQHKNGAGTGALGDDRANLGLRLN